MAEEANITIKDIAEAPAKAVETAAAESAANKASPVKPAARKTTRRKTTSRKTNARKAAPKARSKSVRAKATKTNRKIKAARTSAAAASKRIENMTDKTTKTAFTGFDATNAFAPFQSMFNQPMFGQSIFNRAGERSQDIAQKGQDMAQKGQKVASEMADLTRANVEAMVEASRVAIEGARSIGQDAVATGRTGVERASDAIRSLAEAKSPTEYMQLQSEFARASFDRMVNEGSKLTESMVKLAGEAFQPLQNRASANADRFNTLVA